MIITRTPYRISLFGGGSDYPQWYRQNSGCVIGATIDKYCWLTARVPPQRFGKLYKIVYAKMEEADSITDIQHPAVRTTLQFMGLGAYHGHGLELYHTSDLPARSGVGSSSAFVVGLILAASKLYPKWCKEKDWDKWEIADVATHIEQGILKETVGSQDQILCSFGGFNIVDFPKEGDPQITPVFDNQYDAERCANILEQRLLLFYTGIQRTASDVASGYVPHLTDTHAPIIKKLMGMVNDAAGILRGIAKGDNPDTLGRMLDDAWHAKRRLGNGVSTPEIDNLYDRAWQAGALGGKIGGAGGGGFLLLYVPLDKQAAVREVMKGLLEVTYKFEYDGVSVVYNGDQI